MSEKKTERFERVYPKPEQTPHYTMPIGERDYGLYRELVVRQNDRLTEVNDALLSVAALSVAAISFFGVPSTDAPLLYHVGTAVLGFCVAIEVLARVCYGGRESPDLEAFDFDAQFNRWEALRRARAALLADWAANERAIAAKLRVLRLGVSLAGVVVLANTLYRVLH